MTQDLGYDKYVKLYLLLSKTNDSTYGLLYVFHVSTCYCRLLVYLVDLQLGRVPNGFDTGDSTPCCYLFGCVCATAI